ncbi:hypothetical protein HPB50_022446 [Hyalomma asiaticum]|uniref:Uncharacterized protein n=1 Tax=Hyalomma asiaticum TaxID=266040 RepID=A0ACB7TP58_HYAAI|nr:hypothetical protein HPB50_022446 [Hyalomma asiaticum]
MGCSHSGRPSPSRNRQHIHSLFLHHGGAHCKRRQPKTAAELPYGLPGGPQKILEWESWPNGKVNAFTHHLDMPGHPWTALVDQESVEWWEELLVSDNLDNQLSLMDRTRRAAAACGALD